MQSKETTADKHQHKILYQNSEQYCNNNQRKGNYRKGRGQGNRCGYRNNENHNENNGRKDTGNNDYNDRGKNRNHVKM